MTTQKTEIILEKERFKLKSKQGGGLLQYEVRGYYEKGSTVITRYNLAYINHNLFQSDNGRVLGFDNAHDFHHRHFWGQVEPVEFISYQATLERFQKEWFEIVNTYRN